MKNKLENLFIKYPFLRINEDYYEYLEPNYYNDILKEYSFNGKSDLEIFTEWLRNNIGKRKELNVLELGCGSGRATDEALKVFKEKYNLDVLDLSSQMLDYCKKKYVNNNNIKYIKSDTIEYLGNSLKKYDIVYSLWSYSHSIHQILPNMGYEIGKEFIDNSLKRFITNNLEHNGKMYIIHFDSMSDEQKILMHEWKKLYEIFIDSDVNQSPSFIITNDILKELKNNGIINYKIEHLIGDEIEYKDINEALEVFLNFHMESEFNTLDILPEVIDDLINYFEKYKTIDNKICIKPGCFIITINKV